MPMTSDQIRAWGDRAEARIGLGLTAAPVSRAGDPASNRRGMKGVYQHCGVKHLHRDLAEFDFRYNRRTALGVDERDRAERALAGISGKRLTYRSTNG